MWEFLSASCNYCEPVQELGFRPPHLPMKEDWTPHAQSAIHERLPRNRGSPRIRVQKEAWYNQAQRNNLVLIHKGIYLQKRARYVYSYRLLLVILLDTEVPILAYLNIQNTGQVSGPRPPLNATKHGQMLCTVSTYVDNTCQGCEQRPHMWT